MTHNPDLHARVAAIAKELVDGFISSDAGATAAIAEVVEECARVAESRYSMLRYTDAQRIIGNECAAAIRALAKPKEETGG